MSTPAEPQLAKPGAGLPFIEHLVLRVAFPMKQLQSRQTHVATFRNERSAIRKLIDSSPDSVRGKRVLIPRLRGLEDSSRYWSIWMTLDHLRITNLAFANVIRELSEGRVPPGKADTAAVKPAPESGPETEHAYEKSCDELMALLESIGDLQSQPRFTHPWFGPMSVGAWIALTGIHMGIHRQQISKILAAANPR